MGFAITAATIIALCFIAIGLPKRAEAQDDPVALQNRLEACGDSEQQDNLGHDVPQHTEDPASEDSINLEPHWNP